MYMKLSSPNLILNCLLSQLNEERKSQLSLTAGLTHCHFRLSIMASIPVAVMSGALVSCCGRRSPVGLPPTLACPTTTLGHR